jgi:hypothetical protein
MPVADRSFPKQSRGARSVGIIDMETLGGFPCPRHLPPALPPPRFARPRAMVRAEHEGASEASGGGVGGAGPEVPEGGSSAAPHALNLAQHERFEAAGRETGQQARSKNRLDLAATVLRVGNDFAHLVALACVERSDVLCVRHFAAEGA